MTILLGTVAIEPNRWGVVHPSRRPTVVLDDWLDAIAASGFDGIELWEVARTPAGGVKVNVGADPAGEGAYTERLATFTTSLKPDVAVLCECHAGTIAEDPVTAARILAAAGPADRMQAIVHTHEDDDHLRARFDAYGDRITHVHVNHLDGAFAAPRLADVAETLAAKVDLLDRLGFTGSWTIEFVHGVGTIDDDPAFLVERAAADLLVLREVLAR